MLEPNRQPSQPEQAQREAIRLASTYANFAQNQPLYLNKSAGSRLSAYEWAMKDYFGKPEVLHIDIRRWSGGSGQTIRIQARDNLMVLSVRVRIWDGAQLLEEGEARQCKQERLVWKYTTRTVIPHQPGLRLEVQAFDLPGNSGTSCIELK